jgi:pimeloyl-ACP methyl ester carboxylesterase
MRHLALALLVLAGLATLAAAWWWSHPPDAVKSLRAWQAPLARLERVPRPDLGARVERWRLIDARGDTTFALWRAAAPGASRPWTVVMLGGIGTGDRAALLLPEEVAAHVLAVDWPWRGEREMNGARLAYMVPRLRAALLRTPACLALGLEAVARAPETDTARVALLGASLGAPPSIAALSLSTVPDALVLVDGFAGLAAALRVGLERETRPRWAARPLAALAARLLSPLEPERHRAALGLPALVVNAAHDERLPRESIERLHALLPHATVRVRADTHVLPERLALIAELARSASAWLDSLPTR